MNRSVVWHRRKVTPRTLFVGAACAATLLVGTAPLAQAKDETPTVSVVVMGTSSSQARQKVDHKHGRTNDDLTLVDAVAADVPVDEVAALDADPNVVVVPNVRVDVMDTTDAAPHAPSAVYRDLTGSPSLVAKGKDGKGINVAVLDTGIAKLPDFGNRVVTGVDFSGEGDPFKDSFGHGTFVAGLIAGNGASSNGAYVGMAPGASLVSIKVAGASGSTDLATLLKGIQWAVDHKDKADVLNISLGAAPLPSSVANPLDQAVEKAWRAGVVVVTSAGNTGPSNGTISSPGDDPLVITVGALDDNGTADPSDDTMPSFSAVGPTFVDGWFKPDVVTSGRSVVSLRVPGSTIDVANPSARIGDNNFVGSGTSFSAAIASGAAAQIVQIKGKGAPSDVIKGMLLAGAAPGPIGSPFVDGFGSLNVQNASTVPVKLKQPIPTTETLVGSTVSLFVTSSGSAWNSANWSGSAWNGSSWNGSSWNGSSWNGSSWNGSSWNGSSWNGSSWNGSSWNGSSWNGSAWNGSAWNGSSWNGSSWNGSSWNGSSWNGSAWNGSSWNGSSWNGSSWNGSSWNGSSWNGSSWNGSSWN